MRRAARVDHGGRAAQVHGVRRHEAHAEADAARGVLGSGHAAASPGAQVPGPAQEQILIGRVAALAEAVLRRPAWQEQAACRGLDPDDFVVEPTSWEGEDLRVRRARWVCAECPVRPECLAFAFAAPSSLRWGVYAGTTPAERMSVRDDPRRVPLLLARFDEWVRRNRPRKGVPSGASASVG